MRTHSLPAPYSNGDAPSLMAPGSEEADYARRAGAAHAALSTFTSLLDTNVDQLKVSGRVTFGSLSVTGGRKKIYWKKREINSALWSLLMTSLIFIG